MSGNRLTSVEIQAWSVEEAIRLALEQLGMTEAEVDIEILSEAGSDADEEALVRVTARGMASQPVPKGGGTGGNTQARRQPGPRRVPGDRPSQRGVPPRMDMKPYEPKPIDPNRVQSEEETVAVEIINDLLARLGVTAEVIAVDNPSTITSSEDEPNSIYIEVLGQDLGMLIGRRGEHLAHLQYMINLLANRRLGDWTRVIVDVEGYRIRREEALVALADRVARQVARSGRPIALEPMPPNERRIVHLTLQEHPDVMTESTGEGMDRRITVQPRA